jgi:hypothetical protein
MKMHLRTAILAALVAAAAATASAQTSATTATQPGPGGPRSRAIPARSFGSTRTRGW